MGSASIELSRLEHIAHRDFTERTKKKISESDQIQNGGKWAANGRIKFAAHVRRIELEF